LVGCAQVVNVDGPSVAMTSPYLALGSTAGAPVHVAAELKGPNALPVAANLFLSLRFLSAGVDLHAINVMMPRMLNVHDRSVVACLEHQSSSKGVRSFAGGCGLPCTCEQYMKRT
jgi:hypothetical protein